MLESENLLRVEHLFGFRYPPSFHAGAWALVQRSRTPEFAEQFPRAVLLDSAGQIQALCARGLPGTCIPFLAVEQPAHVDAYCFDISSNGPEYAVAVFAEHAVVQTWPTYADFLGWVDRLCGQTAGPSAAGGDR